MLFCVRLKIPAGHVEPYRIPEDHFGCRQGVNIRARSTDGHHQLDLVVEILSGRRVLDLTTIGHQRIGGLHKEDRRLPLRL